MVKKMQKRMNKDGEKNKGEGERGRDIGKNGIIVFLGSFLLLLTNYRDCLITTTTT